MLKNLGLGLRSFLYWLGFAGSIVVYGAITPFQMLLPYKVNQPVLVSWGTFNLWWLKVTCNLTYQVWGRENIPPNQAVIVVANHQSTFETIAFPQLIPNATWVTKRSLLWIPFFGWGLRLSEPIAIDRSKGKAAIAQIKEQGQALLKQGRSIVIFPEGTRIAPNGHVDYKPGAAILADATGYPMLLIAHNTGYFWPRHSFIKYPGVVTISIGPLLKPAGLDSKTLNTQAQAWIEAERQRLPNPPLPPALS